METYHITLTYVISGLAGIKRNTNHYAHDWSGSKSGVSVVLRIAWQVCNQLLLIHKMRKGNQGDHFSFFFFNFKTFLLTLSAPYLRPVSSGLISVITLAWVSVTGLAPVTWCPVYTPPSFSQFLLKGNTSAILKYQNNVCSYTENIVILPVLPLSYLTNPASHLKHTRDQHNNIVNHVPVCLQFQMSLSHLKVMAVFSTHCQVQTEPQCLAAECLITVTSSTSLPRPLIQVESSVITEQSCVRGLF